jgi:hypothetical protein
MNISMKMFEAAQGFIQALKRLDYCFRYRLLVEAMRCSEINLDAGAAIPSAAVVSSRTPFQQSIVSRLGNNHVKSTIIVHNPLPSSHTIGPGANVKNMPSSYRNLVTKPHNH